MLAAEIAVTLSEEQLSRFNGFPITCPVFEGPMDLLLYLIRRQQIDVYDIPIATITSQFMDYLALMEILDIEIASEFLVMAATLLEIKSRMLLPRPPALLEEEEDEEDPRAELVRRLLEYQQYKGVADALQRRAEEQRRVFSRTSIVPNLPFARPLPGLSGEVDAFSLWTALQSVLARIETMEPAVREVVRPKLTVRSQMLCILQVLASAPEGATFTEIIFCRPEHVPTRYEVIVTFLAMLELMRLRRVAVRQRTLFGEIRLHLLAAQECPVQ
jgi:segregation and condensation protein A